MVDISKITDYLYVGSRMGEEHADELKVLKFDLIISMIAQQKIHDVFTQEPFKSIWIRTYDNFLRPISVKQFLTGIEAALPVIHNKGKVLVFCMEGRRRSVAMASAILIAAGYTSEEAAQLLMKARRVADPRAWYIRMQVRYFERYWNRYHPDRQKEPWLKTTVER
jgi:hypothetical protein